MLNKLINKEWVQAANTGVIVDIDGHGVLHIETYYAEFPNNPQKAIDKRNELVTHLIEIHNKSIKA